MQPYELNINLNGLKYHVLLTPGEQIEFGTKGGRSLPLGMIMGGISEVHLSKGLLEARTTLEGEDLEEWTPVGRFEDRYSSMRSEDCAIRDLTLDLGDTRIVIQEYHDYYGFSSSHGEIQKKRGFLRGWDSTILNELHISRANQD